MDGSGCPACTEVFPWIVNSGLPGCGGEFLLPPLPRRAGGDLSLRPVRGPVVPMLVRGGGGTVQICSRRGCKGHILDLSGVNL